MGGRCLVHQAIFRRVERIFRWEGIEEMRKLASLILLLWLASLSAAAQDFPKAEIFGGYQLTRLDGTTLNGWNAALTGNLNHWFGVTGDFSGAYKSQGGVDFRNYTYTFGPTIAARGNETFTPLLMLCLAGLMLRRVSMELRRAIMPSP